jgi:hypothetical protein
MTNRFITALLALLVTVMLCMTVGCSSAETTADDVPMMGDGAENGGDPADQINDILREFGYSEEEIAAMPAEERDLIAAEIAAAGLVGGAENGGETPSGNENTPAAKRPTYSDISSGGSYVMTVGDSMLWNYIEIHYENGRPVKMVMHFSKDGSEEEADIMVYEGSAIEECTAFDINYAGTPESVAGQLKEKMYYDSVYIEPVK